LFHNSTLRVWALSDKRSGVRVLGPNSLLYK